MAAPKGNEYPSKYSPAMFEKAKNYVVNSEWQTRGRKVPSIADLANYLGISNKTLYNWRDDPKKPEVLHISDQVLQIQEIVLQDGGLSGDFNSTIAKLMLGKHGYADKVEQDNKSSDGSMTPKAGIDTTKLSDRALKEILDATSDEA